MSVHATVTEPLRLAPVRALAPLSRPQRAAVVLIDLLGVSSEQAARMHGVRPPTVLMHSSRAHATLPQTTPHLKPLELGLKIDRTTRCRGAATRLLTRSGRG